MMRGIKPPRKDVICSLKALNLPFWCRKRRHVKKGKIQSFAFLKDKPNRKKITEGKKGKISTELREGTIRGSRQMLLVLSQCQGW